MRVMKTKFEAFTLILFSAWLIAGLISPALGCKRSDFESVIETSQQVIYIRTDGNIDPSTAPIRRDGNTYTFTGDVDAQVIVDKNNIVIDGAGHTLNGPYNGTQTDLWIRRSSNEPLGWCADSVDCGTT
jgi:hypothetical protein